MNSRIQFNRFVLFGMLATGILAFGIYRMNNRKNALTEMDPRRFPVVTIGMLRPTSEVTGMGVRTGSFPGGELTSADRLEPCNLRLTMPDGKLVELPVKRVSWSADGGKVYDVYAWLPLKPMRYREALADLRRTLRTLGADQSEPAKTQMAAWAEDLPASDAVANYVQFKSGFNGVFNKTEVDIRLSQDSSDRSWFYLLIFGVEVDERLKIQREQAAQH